MKLKVYLNESRVSVQTKKDQTGHAHLASVNADGDGETVDTKGSEDHVHIIFQWLTQPTKGHIHNLEG